MGEEMTVWEMLRDGAIVADVIQFSDGQTLTKWRGKYRSLTVYPEWAEAAAIHTRGGLDEGRTRFRLRARIEALAPEEPVVVNL